MASMEKECFWGCELSKDQKEYKWDSEDEELGKADIEQKLVLSQACLGAKAKPDDRNLVEVTTTDVSENTVTHTILSLQCGKTDQCRLSLGFPSSVVFKLVEGSGPVHLTGSVYQELYINEDEDEEDSDEDKTPSPFVKLEASKKRPLASETPKGPPKKIARVEDAEDEDESDDDDEDEEESSEESEKMEVEAKPKPKKPDTTAPAPSKTEGKDNKKQKSKKESEEEEDEDSSEEDTDEEEEGDEDESDEEESDEDESDDDDDEDEEDESDEEDEIAASLVAKKKGGKAEQKKPMTNGVAKSSKKPAAKEKETPSKTQVKQQQNTPKPGGKKDDGKKASAKTPEPMDMDQIKEKLKKTPTLPKKVDKFKNYMRSSFKITDEKVVTNLWDWLKENK